MGTPVHFYSYESPGQPLMVEAGVPAMSINCCCSRCPYDDECSSCSSTYTVSIEGDPEETDACCLAFQGTWDLTQGVYPVDVCSWQYLVGGIIPPGVTVNLGCGGDSNSCTYTYNWVIAVSCGPQDGFAAVFCEPSALSPHDHPCPPGGIYSTTNLATMTPPCTGDPSMYVVTVSSGL